MAKKIRAKNEGRTILYRRTIKMNGLKISLFFFSGLILFIFLFHILAIIEVNKYLGEKKQ